MSDIVLCLRPSAVFQNPDIFENIKCESILPNTFNNYMQLLTRKLKTNIGAVLPGKISLVLACQINPEAHYIALIATVPAIKSSGFSSARLTVSAFEKGTTQNFNEHI